MILLNEYEISEWAYWYCKDISDNLEIREYITTSGWAYSYCKYIKDDPEVRKNITDTFWAFMYCIDINNKNDERLMKLAKEYKP